MPDEVLSAFFLNSPSRVARLELLQISHPSFSKVYRIVRNNRLGVTVTLETGDSEFFEYFPVKIARTNTDNSLEQVFNIAIGDVGETLAKEIDAVAADDAFNIKPQLLYRIYRSDDLTTPLFGPLRLEIVSLPMTRDGASFEAKAETLNRNSTGEVYDLIRFPGLRGFL